MPWLSLPEYSRRTGTPESTVRAMIRQGRLRAELEQRAPGDPRTVWRVWQDEQPQEAAGSAADVRVASETDQPPTTLTEPPAVIMRLMDTVDRQAEQIAELRERVGRAEARAETLQAQVEQYILDQLEQTERVIRAEADLAQLRARRWWRLW